MRKILEASLLYRWLTAAAHWIDRQWERSYLALILTGEKEKTQGPKNLTGRFLGFLRNVWYRLFHALRLDRLLNNSIFGHMFFWSAVAVAVSPIIPTMGVVAMVIVALVSVLIRLGYDRELKMPYSPLNKWMLLFAMVYLAATLTSVTVSGSLSGGLLRVFFIVFAIALQAAVTEKGQVDKLMYVITASGLVVALYGIYQTFTGAENTTAWLDMGWLSTISLRVYSFLENPNVLSEYLLLVIPMAVACCVTAKTSFGKMAAVIAAVSMCVCMVLTYSRGGWLALIVAAAVFLVLLDRRFVVLGIFAVAALVVVMPDTVLERFTSITDLADSSTTYRIYIWQAVVEMLRDYWFCGIGTGVAAFEVVYPAYSFNAVSAPHAHNLFLQLIVECGVLGIFTFMGMVFSFLRLTGSALRRTADKNTRVQIIAVISGVIGFLIQGITEYTLYNFRVTLMFLIVLSIGAILSRPGGGREETA